MDKKKVCIVEDDPDISGLLKLHLEDLNCETQAFENGREALDHLLQNQYDLIILDIRLPELDGLEICRSLRAKEDTTPILMLTARSEEIDKVLGLEIGADDYMTKPFSIREFLARVKALFRRSNQNKTEAPQKSDQNTLRYENLSIELEYHKVIVDGKKVDLSPKEFELLVLLASNPGKNYDRSRLLNMIWGYDFEGYEHTVNSHINRLRSKIEQDMDKPNYIITTWGVGYKFNEEIKRL